MPALLEFRNVSKAFGSVQANKSVSFSVESGSIHALVGENGAGKSTLMKILFGLYQKDSGDILLRNCPTAWSSPQQAKENGVGMVHQHFMLAGPLTALEHIFLDEPSPTKIFHLFRKLDKKAKKLELEKLSALYQMPVNWDEKIENLSVGLQQRIEILKLLHNQSDVLILDEPTAVLTPQEIEALFSQLQELKKSGKTILLITHKLKEVFRLADKVTVFRQGQVVVTRSISETSASELSQWMVGRPLKPLPPPTQEAGTETVFEIRHLATADRKLDQVSLTVHNREILGLAGVEGNGQSELIQALISSSFRQNCQGQILWQGKAWSDPRELRDRGFSYFPEDRLHQGVLAKASAEENFILGSQHSPLFQKWGMLRRSQIQEITRQAMQEFDVRPPQPHLALQNFSGGNQQKLVVARELHRRPSFLLAAQPTRGVDIGAIERIHEEILKLREKGGSVLLISSDLDELMKLSDRILVMFQGRISGEMKRGQFSEMKLGQWMAGVST